MSWARVDDGWWSHPKTIGLTLAARGLWITALSWSCHQRRDVVPAAFLTIAGAKQSEADELVTAGLWSVEDDGWRIHDWADYQDRSLSEKRAAAGAIGGKRSGQARRAKADEKQARSNREASDEAGARPVPALPEPESKSGKRQRRTAMPDDWTPDPSNVEKLRGKYPKLNVDAEVGKFRDYWISRGEVRADWNAGLRTWMAKADEYRQARDGERTGGWR